MAAAEGTAAFREARDFLLAHREDYAEAYAQFEWPRLGTFNWDPTRSHETHPNHPLFRTDGAWNRYVAIPEMMALYEKMAKDYGLR